MKRPFSIPLLVVCLLIICLPLWVQAQGITVILTADAEGHINPCQTCPMHAGAGGLARRATLLDQVRATDGANIVLLDAGNSLFGDESFDSDGMAVGVAFDSLGYDALNVSYKDFPLGKQTTLTTLGKLKTPVVSANILDTITGKLIAAPFVIKTVGGRKIAILGISDSPAALTYLPRWKRQLAGIRILSAAEALREWIPKAKAQAGDIVLLYSGSLDGAVSIRDTFGNDLAAILVSGIEPDELQGTAATKIVAAEKHGRTLAKFLIDDKDKINNVEQLLVAPSLVPDAKMTALLAPYAPKPIVLTTQPAAAVAPANPPPVPPASPPTSPPPNVASTSPAPAPAAPVPPRVAPPVIESPRTFVVVPGSPLRVAGGLSDTDVTPEQINQAIDRGSAFLWKYLKTKDIKDKPENFGGEAEHVLCALALVHCDAQHQFPDFDLMLRNYLQRAKPEQTGIYRSGIMNMLIEGYGDPAYTPLMLRNTRYLLESQGTQGRFNYVGCTDAAILQLDNGPATQPSAGWTRNGKFSPGYDGDNSVTQFGVLGLHTASRLGVHLPNITWQKILDGFRAEQLPGGGWSYTDTGSAYGSMTCAGICSIAISRFNLGQTDLSSDPNINRGLKWLGDHFAIDANPLQGPSWHYYYLYSLERTGRILNSDFIDGREWYPLGASYLVHHQNADGSWIGEGGEKDPRLATSFALLFLTRATPKLLDTRIPENGKLQTVITAPTRRFYIILDCSGSMIDVIQGKQKFKAARDAVARLIESLPQGSQAALRVYGHRKNALETDADSDTELKIPMGDVDQKTFAAALASLHARGKTPLTLSLELAKTDIGTPDKSTEVLLLTDGGEDTYPRKNPIPAAADLVKTPKVNLNIVGFDIQEHPEWKKQLIDMTKASHGSYWSADKIDDLDAELQEAALNVPKGFTILDRAAKVINQGIFGNIKSLAPGDYILRTDFGGKVFDQPFTIRAGEETGILFDAARMQQ